MDPEPLLPRQELRASLLAALEARSVTLYGPRRVGKSTLLDQLERTPPPGWRAARIDLEGLSSNPVPRMVDAVRGRLVQLGWMAAPTSGLDRIESLEVLGVGGTLRPRPESDPWAELERILRQVTERPDRTRFILALDELPWWLDALESGSAGGARSALANLRRIRQARPVSERIRFVLTGSIGLAGLAASLDASAELNDLDTVVVEPLSGPEGEMLFEMESTARGGRSTRPGCVLASQLAGGSPHWIKELASRVPTREQADEGAVERAAESLMSPLLRKLFADEGSQHFRRRHPDRIPALSAILDTAAAGPSTPLEGAITAALAAQPALSRGQARECAFLLVDAFYFRLDADDALHWCNPLFQRWWQRYGGL